MENEFVAAAVNALLSLEGREIVQVKMHGGYFVGAVQGQQQVGELGDTLPPTGKTLELKMTHVFAGVYVKCSTPGKKAEFLIPWPNIKGVTYRLT